MKIQCNKCKTGYKINPEKLPLSGAVLTCKRCGGKFRVAHPGARKASPAQKSLPRVERNTTGPRRRPSDVREPTTPETPATSASARENAFAPTSDITDGEYTEFIQKNPGVYLKKFSLFYHGDYATTWHWPAFFIPPAWFLYRKMYLLGLLSIVLNYIPLFNVLARFYWGFTANHLYYKRVRKKIWEIKKAMPTADKSAISLALRESGGVNWMALLIALIPVILIIAAIAVPNFISFRDKAYDAAARVCLEDAVAAQETHFDVYREYAPDVEELSSEYGSLCNREGMSLRIHFAGAETYFMESVYKNGKARYIALGPAADMVKVNGMMTTFHSDGGAFQITAPRDWKDTPELNDEAELTIGALSEDCYAAGFVESRSDVPGGVFVQYSKMARARFMEGLRDAEFQRTTIRSIDGLRAIQHKIVGVFPENDAHLTFLHTVIEGDDSFYQLVVWTESRNFEAKENLFNYMVMRFERL